MRKLFILVSHPQLANMQGNNEDETEQSQTQPPSDEDSGEDKGEDKGDNKGEDKGENNGQDNANEVLWGVFFLRNEGVKVLTCSGTFTLAFCIEAI